PGNSAPAFILDARRAGENVQIAPGQFDNRWTLFVDDFPSAEQLRAAKIERIVVVQRSLEVEPDVLAIARTYQRAGLGVRIAEVENKSLFEIPGRPRGWLRTTFDLLARGWHLRRRADGSYGLRVPIPPEPSHG